MLVNIAKIVLSSKLPVWINKNSTGFDKIALLINRVLTL